jgi:hypothetical protein
MQRTNHVPRVIHRFLKPLLCGAALLSSLPLPAAETRYGIDAELVADDNVNRGQSGYDRSDTIVSVEGNIARSLLLSYRSGLILRGGLRYENFVDFSDLSNLSLNARVAYRFQPNPGYSGMSFELAGDVQALRHKDSDIRDGFLYSLSASLAKHLTDRIRISAGANLGERSADTGDVFDMSTNNIWFSGDYRLSKAVFYGSLARISGDHVSTTAVGSYPGLSSAYYEAWAVDPAYTDACGGVTPWAYRIEAVTMAYELGANIPMRGNHALDFSARFYDTEADRGGFTYDGMQLRAVYFYRF